MSRRLSVKKPPQFKCTDHVPEYRITVTETRTGKVVRDETYPYPEERLAKFWFERVVAATDLDRFTVYLSDEAGDIIHVEPW